MKYINKYEIPKYKDKLLYKDIVLNSNCTTNVYHWMMDYILANKEQLSRIIEKYQEVYPYACRKLLIRFEELEKNRQFLTELLPFEEKVKIFMKYIEINNIPSQVSNIKFNNLDKNIKDTTNVGCWLRDQSFKNLYRFYIEISKYKSIYPNAYMKVTNKINNSYRLQKQRRLLINVLNILTQIKDELDIDERLKKYNKVR